MQSHGGGKNEELTDLLTDDQNAEVLIQTFQKAHSFNYIDANESRTELLEKQRTALRKDVICFIMFKHVELKTSVQ